jgi:glycosyltransferase involved in cell wall biosynthesis
MRCGALVIASRDPAILEVTQDRALHFEAGETGELARLLAEVADNPAKYDALLREEAQKRAEGFTWKACAIRTREVYGEAARRFSHA